MPAFPAWGRASPAAPQNSGGDGCPAVLVTAQSQMEASSSLSCCCLCCLHRNQHVFKAFQFLMKTSVFPFFFFFFLGVLVFRPPPLLDFLGDGSGSVLPSNLLALRGGQRPSWGCCTSPGTPPSRGHVPPWGHPFLRATSLWQVGRELSAARPQKPIRQEGTEAQIKEKQAVLDLESCSAVAVLHLISHRHFFLIKKTTLPT